MNYQVGQAVISKEKLWFVTHICSSGNVDIQNMAGQYDLTIDKDLCAATEAEILAEAVKHGWERQDLGYLVGKHINIFKSERKGWRYSGGSTTTTENLKELSEEGLTAHRLITALNLAKQ